VAALLVLCGPAALSGCGDRSGPTAAGSASGARTLAEARKGFTTHLVERFHDGTPAEEPPSGVVRLVHYPSPAGQLAAYLTPTSGPGPAPGDPVDHRW